MPQMVDEGLNIIRRWEGKYLKPYLCPAGHATIGYGHTQGVTLGSAPISDDEAESLLKSDVIFFGGLVDHFINMQLTDNQYSALVSLTMNEGSTPLQRHLGMKLNAGDVAGAANEFDKWVYAHLPVTNQIVKLPGLVTRRAAEKALFLEADC